jgi:hypothetical protein
VGSWEELKRGVRMDREGEEVQDPISEFWFYHTLNCILPRNSASRCLDITEGLFRLNIKARRLIKDSAVFRLSGGQNHQKRTYSGHHVQSTILQMRKTILIKMMVLWS